MPAKLCPSPPLCCTGAAHSQTQGALFPRAHTGTCAAKFLARPVRHSWLWLSQNWAHMVNRQQHQWKSGTCFELAGDRSRSIWQERPLVVVLCVCARVLILCSVSQQSTQTEEDACTATTPCSSLTGSWDNAWPKGIRWRTLSPVPKEVQALQVERCENTVWLVKNGCVCPLKWPNKCILPIKRNNYSLTNQVLKNYSFKTITATSSAFHFIAAYASKNNKLNGDLMGTRDQLMPRDFLPGFHENNCIIMVCDINISFGKVRQQLHREGCSMSYVLWNVQYLTEEKWHLFISCISSCY